MAQLPGGPVTFFLTDIEGSTRLWEAAPEAMLTAVERHDALIEAGISRHGGVLLKSRGEGDSHFAVFASPAQAVAAACALQRALHHEPWPTPWALRVRMALHSGQAQLRDGDYYGPAVNRCARLRALAHGDQILLSEAVRDRAAGQLPAGATLHDWGEHPLKDLSRPERVYQLLPADLPARLTPLASSRARLHHLPLPLTRLVGRRRERARLQTLLTTERLVTLTGIGGCGKTRLAVAAADELAGWFRDGVCLVELAALGDPLLVTPRVLAALGVRAETEDVPPLDQLLDALHAQHLLLVLDNCEHLHAACAALTRRLLSHCPKLHVLITSREGLGLAGEAIFPVPPLSPPGGAPPAAPGEALVAHVLRSEAVRLFVERAAEAQPRFALDAGNARTVAQICQRLEGLPLAIELAAARLRVLSLNQIARRLDDRFRLLAGGPHAALPHQQTLQAAMDWSYDLLSPPEQALLLLLSVFVGRFTLEAVEGVCAAGGESAGPPARDVLEHLTRLADKSLVLVDAGGDPAGYRLLDTVRQYGLSKLADAGRLQALRDAHRDGYLALAEAGEPALQGPDQADWLDRLERAQENLHAALEWCVVRRDGAGAVRLAGALWWYWHVRGHWREGRGWLETALSVEPAPPDAPARAKALNGLGVLCWRLGAYREAAAHLDRSLELYRALSDASGAAYALNALGMLAHRQGDNARAIDLLEQSLALFREIDDPRGVAYDLNVLALVAQRQGDNVRAARLCEACLELRRQLGDKRGIALILRLLGTIRLHQARHAEADALHRESLSLFEALQDAWGIANALGNLALVAHHRADPHTAERLFAQSLERHRSLGEPSAIASSWEGLAQVAGTRGDWVRVAQLCGAAEALRGAVRAPLPEAQRAPVERVCAAARRGLGEDAFRAAHGRGRQRPLEDAIEYALARALGRPGASQRGA